MTAFKGIGLTGIFPDFILEIITYELSLSLDVIYHILDDNEYKKYMEDLFKFSNKYVIIYSNNY